MVSSKKRDKAPVVAVREQGEERPKALETALGRIEKGFGKILRRK